MKTPLLSINNIHKTYDKTIVLNNLSFELGHHDKISVMGPSGSGKTTLLRLIMGLEKPNKGEIKINGQSASNPKHIVLAPHHRQLGVVFQNAALWPHMNIEKNIYFPVGKNPSKESSDLIHYLCEQMNLFPLLKKYPKHLSGGESKRVALARALAANPTLILMDEPLTNLDKALKEKMMIMIEKIIQDTHKSLIYVSHDIDECEFFSSNIYHMKEGKLIHAS